MRVHPRTSNDPGIKNKKQLGLVFSNAVFDEIYSFDRGVVSS
jgi:hypothetical protein